MDDFFGSGGQGDQEEAGEGEESDWDGNSEVEEGLEESEEAHENASFSGGDAITSSVILDQALGGRVFLSSYPPLFKESLYLGHFSGFASVKITSNDSNASETNARGKQAESSEPLLPAEAESHNETDLDEGEVMEDVEDDFGEELKVSAIGE